MAEKAQDDIVIENRLRSSDELRLEFWTTLLKEMTKKSELFKNISPKKENWINAGSGISGVLFTFSISKTYARVELYIDMGDKAENKKLFDYLYQNKKVIEEVFGEAMIWERLDDKRASRISSSIDKNSYDRENWNSIITDLQEGYKIEKYDIRDLDVEAAYQDITLFPIKDDTKQVIYVGVLLINRRVYRGKREIEKAKEHIEKHWMDRFDANETAKAACLSKAHFTKRT